MTDIALPELDAAKTINRVIDQADNERLRSMALLLNTFNYAVQVQARRNEWTPSDFRVFAIALCAMDQIGLNERATDKKLSAIVENELARTPRLASANKIS